MALINCPNCGKVVSDATLSCPNCGKTIGEYAQDVKNINVQHNQTYGNGSKDIIFMIDQKPVNMTMLWKENKNKDKCKKQLKKQYGADEKTANKMLDDFFRQSNGNVKKPDSVLSTIAFLVTLFGCGFLSIVGLVLAIIDLAQNDNSRQHGWSQAAIGVFVVWIFLFVAVFKGTDTEKSNNKPETTEISTIQQSSTQENTTENYVEKEEIKFEGIDWSATFLEAKEIYSEWQLWNLSGEDFKTCSVDEILYGDSKGIDFEYGNINIVANALKGEQEIAGYTTSEIILYFSYLPIDNYLTYDENDTALYGAQYKFKPTSLSEMQDDLVKKLTSKYGEADDITEDTDIWQNKYTYIHWRGGNDTEIVMKCTDSTGDTTGFYEDEIQITYAWRGGDKLLQNASDAVKNEKLNKEKEAQESDDANGL